MREINATGNLQIYELNQIGRIDDRTKLNATSTDQHFYLNGGNYVDLNHQCILAAMTWLVNSVPGSRIFHTHKFTLNWFRPCDCDSPPSRTGLVDTFNISFASYAASSIYYNKLLINWTNLNTILNYGSIVRCLLLHTIIDNNNWLGQMWINDIFSEFAFFIICVGIPPNNFYSIEFLLFLICLEIVFHGRKV